MARATASGVSRRSRSSAAASDAAEGLQAVVGVVDGVVLLQARPAGRISAAAGRRSGGRCSPRPSWPGASRSTRLRISSAALLVKVRARICWSGTPSASSWAMRWVTTRVLPLPGPARISSGPSPCKTASHGVRSGLRGTAAKELLHWSFQYIRLPRWRRGPGNGREKIGRSGGEKGLRDVSSANITLGFIPFF